MLYALHGQADVCMQSKLCSSQINCCCSLQVSHVIGCPVAVDLLCNILAITLAWFGCAFGTLHFAIWCTCFDRRAAAAEEDDEEEQEQSHSDEEPGNQSEEISGAEGAGGRSDAEPDITGSGSDSRQGPAAEEPASGDERDADAAPAEGEEELGVSDDESGISRALSEQLNRMQ